MLTAMDAAERISSSAGTAAVVAWSVFAVGCVARPESDEPTDRTASAGRPTTHRPSPAEPPSPDAADRPPAAADRLPAEPPNYEALPVRDGVRGGRVTILLPGTPAQVAAMLLDFADDAANRPWRSACRLLSAEGDVHRARGTWGDGIFKVERTLEHRIERRPDGTPRRITFRVTDPAPGMTVFDGEYVLEPAVGDPAQTRLTESLRIASGIVFRPVSQEEIRDGLLEDAARLRDWMSRRLRVGSPTPAPY
jgi:hypothetical protein